MPRDNQTAARALAEWCLQGFNKAAGVKIAKTHGITSRTLYNWKNELESNSEFSPIFQEALYALTNSSWADELSNALTVAIQTGLKQVQNLPPEADSLRAINEYIKNIGELMLAQQIINNELSNESSEMAAYSATGKELPSGSATGYTN